MVFSACAVYFVLQTFITTYLPRKIPLMLNPSGDIFGRRHSIHLKQIGKFCIWYPIPAIALTLLFAIFCNGWGSLENHPEAKYVILALNGLLTWRAVTQDIDLVNNAALWWPRVVVLVSAFGAAIDPAFIIISLFTGFHFLRSYYHHQHMLFRVLLASLSVLGLSEIVARLPVAPGSGEWDITSFWLSACLFVVASHYTTPGVGKLCLASTSFGWVKHNKLSNIAVGAYVWGWARWIREPLFLNAIKQIKRGETFFQAATIIVELSAFFILVNAATSTAFLIGFIAFHSAVFLLTGILFWQNISVSALILLVSFVLPADTVAKSFGLVHFLGSLPLFVLIQIRQFIWITPKLSWWDTPLYQKMRFQVRGVSGQLYGLYNNFLCPDERVFGQTYGKCFHSSRPLTSHIGETHHENLAKQLVELESAEDALAMCDDSGQTDGKNDSDEQKDFTEYMEKLFGALNRGERKRVVPRWLKTPGGQCFYWGELEAYNLQERVAALEVFSEDHFYKDDRIYLLNSSLVKRIEFAGDE